MGILHSIAMYDVGGSLDGVRGRSRGHRSDGERRGQSSADGPGRPQPGRVQGPALVPAVLGGDHFLSVAPAPGAEPVPRELHAGSPWRSSCWPSALFNSSWAVIQLVLWGRKITRTKIDRHPIFILGHWRAGTTLAARTHGPRPAAHVPRHLRLFCPEPLSCCSARCLPRLISVLMPTLRPMDNMPAGWDRPAGGRIRAVQHGGPVSLPDDGLSQRAAAVSEYLTLCGRAARGAGAMEAGAGLVLAVRHAGRIRGGSCSSRRRTPAGSRPCWRCFPDARFVHIVRDPLVVFASTVNLWKRLYRYQGLQMPHYRDLEERVFQTFQRMYEAFEQDRPLIPPSRFSEVRYEDLIADPIGQMRRIYEELELGRVRQGPAGVGEVRGGPGRLPREPLRDRAGDSAQRSPAAGAISSAKYGYAPAKEQDAA